MASVAAVILVGLNLLALPYFAFLLVSALAAWTVRRRTPSGDRPSRRFLVVIPAHDEEDGLAATIRSCLALDFPSEGFEVLVIADNCTDGTAAVARDGGVEVLERHDETRKSKGYAIEDLIDGLKQSGRIERYDALVVIDADSTASANLLRALDEALHSADWAQCFYTVANPDDSWRTRLLTYAFTLFNGVIPLGQWRLGHSAGFKGNGMCFSTMGLERVPWRCRGLVEDMEYSWEVRLAGGRIAFVPEARVLGVMLARGGPAAAAQRRRWEFGRKALKSRVIPELWRSSRLALADRVLALLEVTMPTMVSMLALAGGLVLLNLGTARFLSLPAPVPTILLGFCGLILLAIAVYALTPFVVFRLPWSYVLTLMYVPFYAAWTLIVSLGGRPTQWVRTAREHAAK